MVLLTSWHRTTSSRHLQAEGPAMSSSAYHMRGLWHTSADSSPTARACGTPSQMRLRASTPLRNGSPSFASDVEITPAPCKWPLLYIYAPVPWNCRHIQPHTHSTRYPCRVLYYIGRRRRRRRRLRVLWLAAIRDVGGGDCGSSNQHTSTHRHAQQGRQGSV